MVLQAFIDESIGADGTIVMGGHVASVETWARFAADWEKMLSQGLRDERGQYFHMAEMAGSPERMSRVPGFYRLIEDHLRLSVSVRFNANDLARARKRLYVPGVTIDWGFAENPWMVAFRSLVDMFHSPNVRADAADVIPADAVVDFIFDDHSHKGQIRAAWDQYLRERPEEVLKRFGREPRFEDDRAYMPLQAADLWVWWVRKWHSEGVASERIEDPVFDGWSAGAKAPGKLDIWFDEDDMTNALKAILRSLYGGGMQVYDLKPSPVAGRLPRRSGPIY